MRGNFKQLFDPFRALDYPAFAFFDPHWHIVAQKAVWECPEFFYMDIYS